MAYGEKYKIEFDDHFGDLVRVVIEQDGYTGSSTDITGGPTPVSIEWMSTSDEFFKPIKGSVCTLEVVSTTDLQFLTMFISPAKDYQITVSKGADAGSLVTQWRGFLDPDDYREPYLYPPYISTLQCNDGIGRLKEEYIDKPATTGSSTFKEKQFIEIIAECLEKTGLSLSIYTSIDLAVTANGSRTLTGRVLEDVYDDWRKYFNEDDGEDSIDCYTVLEDILNFFDARLYQRLGFWWIDRILDKKDATMDYNLYTSAGSYNGAVNNYDNATILTGAGGSPLCVWVDRTPVLEVVPALKKFELQYAPLKQENILKFTNYGGEFIDDEFISSGGGNTFKFWNYLEVDPYGNYSWSHSSGTDYLILSGYIYPAAARPIAHAYLYGDSVWFEPFRMSLNVEESPIFKISSRVKLIKEYGSYTPSNCFFGYRLVATCTDAVISGGLITYSSGDTLTLYSGEDEWSTVATTYCGSSWTFSSYNVYQEFTHTIGQPLRVDTAYTGTVRINMEIYPVQLNVDNSSSSDFRLEINSVKVEVLNDDIEEDRTIDYIVNEDNRYVPSTVEKKFAAPISYYNGDHWSQYMVYDSDAEPLSAIDFNSGGNVFNFPSAYTPYANQYKIPHIKLSGLLLSDDIDFGVTLEDSDARRYMCIGVTWNIKTGMWEGVWEQIYDADNTLAGDYDPSDYGGDFWTYTP